MGWFGLSDSSSMGTKKMKILPLLLPGLSAWLEAGKRSGMNRAERITV